ncbi:MAG: hypothetical protein HUU19_16290 [Phycisphaerales bacterium]|nr:hypothetical protein [Phycisphaerales bacterium]
MRKNHLLFCALAGALSLSACEKVSDNAIRAVDMADVAKASKDADKSYLIVDARDAASFSDGHIPGSRRLTAAEIDFNNPDPKLRNYKAIYVYGEHPNHNNAKALVKRLMTADIDDVYLMNDGFLGWKAHGYPIDTKKAP